MFIAQWWAKYAKQRICCFFEHEAKCKAEEQRAHENFLYDCIYEVLRADGPILGKSVKLKKLHAQIVRIHARRMKGLTVENADNTHFPTEKPSMHHLLQTQKRRERRAITEFTNQRGIRHTTPIGFIKTCTTEIQEKYDKIDTESEDMRDVADEEFETITNESNESIGAPLQESELQDAIKQGARRKSPGPDGISPEFYVVMWEIIKDDMLLLFNKTWEHESLTDEEKQENILCIPETAHATILKDYRLLTLLNTDYKFLARIIAARTRPTLNTIIYHGQYCGMPGMNTVGAAGGIRDVTAYAELTGKSMCLLSIDFSMAFDRIAHAYLFNTLKSHGYSNSVVGLIQSLYVNAKSRVKINGKRAGPIDVRCSVRQACPLNMILFILALNSLLVRLDRNLLGVRINQTQQKTSVIAYADDVTIILTDHSDIRNVELILTQCMKTSGARISVNKSVAINMGGWDTTRRMLNVPYNKEATIFGIRFANTINSTIAKTWAPVEQGVQCIAKQTYLRELSPTQRIRYVNVHILSNLWYIA
jgi:hypothetical protein